MNCPHCGENIPNVLTIGPMDFTNTTCTASMPATYSVPWNTSNLTASLPTVSLPFIQVNATAGEGKPTIIYDADL